MVGDQLEVKYAPDGEETLESGGLKTGFGPREGAAIAPKFLFGGTAEKNDDRMQVLARFMTQRSNTQLPRMLANRVWSWLLGTGVVHPVDDFNLKNKPLSPGLLEAMVRILLENNTSMRYLVRVICNTQAYQMPTPEEAPEGESFRHLALRQRIPRPPPALPSPPAPLPFQLELPGAWTRVKEARGSKGLFLIPLKEDKARFAELGLYSGVLGKEQWLSQTGLIDPMKSTVLTVTGKGSLTITFTEQSGTNWCQQKAEGPVDYRFWMVEIQAARPWHFRVGAPADLLDPWHDEFVGFLKSLK
jgi:hypothetical protein